MNLDDFKMLFVSYLFKSVIFMRKKKESQIRRKMEENFFFFIVITCTPAVAGNKDFNDT